MVMNVTTTKKMKKHLVVIDVTIQGTHCDRDKTATWALQQLINHAMERMTEHDLARRSVVRAKVVSYKRHMTYLETQRKAELKKKRQARKLKLGNVT